ncbi:MAG TPA: YCF48-related protein, partial [Patescibacteria group bacterium]
MKKILITTTLATATLVLSGCSLAAPLSSTKNPMASATFIKSADAGTTWQPKIKIDDKKTIAGINVLSMAINPQNTSVIYIGTESNGLFMTKDGGETWSQVAFADKAYGLAFDPSNPDIMYGSGVFNGRAKIFKRLQEGQEWKEVYTEPSDGTTISSIAVDRVNSQVIYAGTSEGVIIKSTDGGSTWVNLKKATGPITNIAFDAANDYHVFFAVFQTGVLETTDGGKSINDISSKIDTTGHTSSVFTLVTDPVLGGVVYAGTGRGIFRRNGGDTWTSVNIIESSKAFPIRSIAVNPRNSREIIYASAKAIYKSTDGGSTWSTIQLDTSKDISVLKYDSVNVSN